MTMKPNTISTMVLIKAKFDSTCSETGKEIKSGEECVWMPGAKKVFHVNSNAGFDFMMFLAENSDGDC